MPKVFCLFLALLALSACGSGGTTGVSDPPPSQAEVGGEERPPPQQEEAAEPPSEEPTLQITVGDWTLSASFADNSSAKAFQELLSQGPVTVEMTDYGGFEKVGPLGTTLPQNDQPITTEPGDVILYQGDQITIYYGTNSWNFTRLARIDDPADLQEKLGEGTVSVTFSLA